MLCFWLVIAVRQVYEYSERRHHSTATTMTYLYTGLMASTADCYNVFAVDTANNESAQSSQVCN